VVGGALGGTGVATKRDTSDKAVAKKPITAVKANSIYSPDCDKKKLAGTKAATFDKRPGSTKVSFCVNASGKVVDVKTTKKFRGDPKVDQICRDTVKKWRFRPFMAGGKPVKTCSSVEFQLVFD
jgi:protein TonB